MAGCQTLWKYMILGCALALAHTVSWASRDPASTPPRNSSLDSVAGSVLSRRSFEGGTYSTPLNLSIVGSGGPQLKEELMKQALNMTDNRLYWPPLPRALDEFGTKDYIQSNTAIGLKLAGQLGPLAGSVSARKVFDFRIEFKSSFVLLVSRDEKNSEIYNNDPRTMRSYPVPLPHRPMVGFCVFESNFAFDSNFTSNGEFAGNGTTYTKGKIKTRTSTHTSQFFQIDGRLAIDEYEEMCLTLYRSQVEDQVVKDFTFHILGYFFHNHPDSGCKPELNPVPGKTDATCEEWFKKTVPKAIRSLTVARCEQRADHAHRCTLKAKRTNLECPLYWNRKKGVVTERLSAMDMPVSNNDHDYPSFPCDKAAGLTCQVESHPWMLGRIPLTNGVGRCR
ncbi:MAG: hypothetical protein AB7G93_18655 [Bdellovibrionales bacterium]